jgi:dipeptidase E
MISCMNKLLLLSNSTNPGEDFLSWPEPYLVEFLKDVSKDILFVPYAAVSISFDEYAARVSDRFRSLGHRVVSAHTHANPEVLLQTAGAVMVGGGNTFHLLKHLQDTGLMDAIKLKVNSGLPYIGWSAGSSVACPTICTTNDMPIVETKNLAGFNFLPFQINPHYTDFVVKGHGGETRDQRIEEFLMANPSKLVVGLREGSLLTLNNGTLQLLGKHSARVFSVNNRYDIEPGSDCSFLLSIDN